MQNAQSRTIRHVIILANTQKSNAQMMVEEISAFLQGKQISYTPIFTSDAQETIEVPSHTDLAICLGGDGTVLSCARMLHTYGIPMLAVNLGTFGFITEVGKDEWQEVFELYEKGEATVSRRLMVRVAVHRDGNRIFQAHGLNELAIAASGISKMVSLELFVNQTNTGRIRSDGIIVSTPTGSTGYSLAAGGPILDVTLDALIVNPVCPFTLSNRPLVISGEDVVKIEILPGQKTQISLTVDGQLFFLLEERDEVVIEKARSKALLIESNQRNYYEVIRDKLNWSGGLHA